MNCMGTQHEMWPVEKRVPVQPLQRLSQVTVSNDFGCAKLLICLLFVFRLWSLTCESILPSISRARLGEHQFVGV